MGVKNSQKTVKKIWKNTENVRGFEHFKPHWSLEFEDGTKSSLKLDQENAAELCAKLSEGGSYLFTLEDGVYNGKAWSSVKDVLAQGGMPPVKKVETPKTGTTGTDTTLPLQGITIGNIFNNATLLVSARVQSGQLEATHEAMVKDLNFFCEYFEKQTRRGTFLF